MHLKIEKISIKYLPPFFPNQGSSANFIERLGPGTKHKYKGKALGQGNLLTKNCAFETFLKISKEKMELQATITQLAV